MVAVAATTTKTTVEALRVAVIGGGAAGLSAARILSRNGIEPVVFEKDTQVGGVWNYEESTQQKAKPMYRGLRTNLPREVMRYREQPWGTRGPPTDDGLPSYVTHKDVLQYLKDFRQQFKLDQHIRYGTQVTNLKVLKDEKSQVQLTTNEELPMFELEFRQQQDAGQQCQIFDAVCVANGHYAKPAFAHVEGMKEYFKGNVLHSIEYDDPTIYKGKTVLCIGGRASGSDLAREISHHATKVYLSDTTCKTAESWQNVHWVPTTQRVNPDGSIEFGSGDDAVHDIDTIIFCTGYDYEFPFISSPETSNLELSFLPGERRVKPLYKQFWHAQYPNLAFIGLPHSVVPFPLFELQMEAFVYQLLLAKNSSNDSNDNSPSKVLPALEERVKEAMVDAESGGPKPAGSGRLQDTHFLGSYQWDYCREMADWANNLTPEVERYISTNKAIYDHAGSERKGLFPGGPDTYRSTCYSRLNTGGDDKDASGYFEVTSTKMTSATTEEATAAAAS